MNLSYFPDDVWIERGPNILLALIGGQCVWDIMLDHHAGMSDRDIEAKHGVPKTTARRWIRQAKVKMREAGLNADAVKGYADRHAEKQSQHADQPRHGVRFHT